MSEEVVYEKPTLQDLDCVTELEAQSYPPDEKASRETLKFRIENAIEHFRVIKKGGEIIGFICGTASNEDGLSQQSMFSHVSHGKFLKIHSVVVQAEYRRRGIALAAVKYYLQNQKEENNIQKVLLLSKQHLIPLYQKAGFTLVGPSSVNHGEEQWYELTQNL